MLRAWPSLTGSDAMVVRWPRNLGMVILVGIFAIIMAALIPLLIYLKATGKLPEDLEAKNFGVMMFFLGIFGFACVGGFISSVKNYINPFVRFVANHEGLFLNITFKMKEAFFVPWDSIEKIEKTIVKRSVGKGSVQHVDSVGIFIKPEANIAFPKVMRGVEDTTKMQVNFPKDTLDGDLEDFLSQLNARKSQWT